MAETGKEPHVCSDWTWTPEGSSLLLTGGGVEHTSAHSEVGYFKQPLLYVKRPLLLKHQRNIKESKCTSEHPESQMLSLIYLLHNVAICVFGWGNDQITKRNLIFLRRRLVGGRAVSHPSDPAGRPAGPRGDHPALGRVPPAHQGQRLPLRLCVTVSFVFLINPTHAKACEYGSELRDLRGDLQNRHQRKQKQRKFDSNTF